MGSEMCIRDSDLTSAIRLRKALASLSVHPVLAEPASVMDARLMQDADFANVADAERLRRCGAQARTSAG
mgnify:CR=1 FL=1